ncbi:hypothetical protein N9551_03965, partial [Flavobacteriaceae bacterium]|nr:hypothetical protein [Flavobacteriaceae bacterium]
EGDVISIYSGAYTNITDVDFFPNWDQTTLFNEFDLEGDTMLQYSDLNYQGIDFTSNPVDASFMEYIHVDIWTSDENEAIISPISTGPNETAYELDLTAQQWTSFDIPLSVFTDQNPDVDFADVIQFKLEGSPVGGAIFVDNFKSIINRIGCCDRTTKNTRTIALRIVSILSLDVNCGHNIRGNDPLFISVAAVPFA